MKKPDLGRSGQRAFHMWDGEQNKGTTLVEPVRLPFEGAGPALGF